MLFYSWDELGDWDLWKVQVGLASQKQFREIAGSLWRYSWLFQTEAVRVLTGEKLHTIQLMVEEERRNVEQLRQEMAVSPQVSLTLRGGNKQEQACTIRM